MSLLKLAAFGAEILNMMDQNEDWDADFTQRMGVLAEQMGLEGDSGEFFRAACACRQEMQSLAADVALCEKKGKPVVLEYMPAGATGDSSLTISAERSTITGNSNIFLSVGGRAYEL